MAPGFPMSCHYRSTDRRALTIRGISASVSPVVSLNRGCLLHSGARNAAQPAKGGQTVSFRRWAVCFEYGVSAGFIRSCILSAHAASGQSSFRCSLAWPVMAITNTTVRERKSLRHHSLRLLPQRMQLVFLAAVSRANAETSQLEVSSPC